MSAAPDLDALREKASAAASPKVAAPTTGADDYERPPDSAYQEEEGRQRDAGGQTAPWVPPAVTSYGEAFDPAAIPLRQWLIRGRYARGEGTAIAGPPGTNKSTLLLIDAVQLVTGRSLIGDVIDRSGGVLFLVGEDRRRDFEARLAGVCEHYRIAPRELGNRLHVVYQSEIDPSGYTLAEMIDDMATLNTAMFEWLRAFPDLVALLIDPMLSWHRLIENENAAMQLLCVALRGLATQGNLAVAFDHHVTKVAMFDVEAHVGNLAAMRGASAIAADMRWAFTMAKLKAETAAQYGISEEDRRVYRRLDTLKASYGPDDDAPRLLKIESVRIANGEHVGVLTSVDAERLRADGQERAEQADQHWRDRLTDALARMLREKRPRSASEAALWLATREPQLYLDAKKRTPQSDRTVYRKLPLDIGDGLDTVSNGRPTRIIVRVSGIGNGARREVDFEQGALA
jgi:RecA-family ATPase